MNQSGVIYFTPDSNNIAEDCGAITLSNTTLKRQKTYYERHKDDISIKPLFVRIFDTFKPTIILCIIILITFKIIIMNGFIPSESMEPTLMIGDGVVVNRLSYITTEPTRGDIIVFKSAEYSGEYLIKRVVGIPGDVIDIKDGSVYINGCRLIEEYAVGETLPALSNITHFEVPANSVFLLGDNREFSADSRWWENPYITYEDIIGEAILQYSLNVNKNGLYVHTVDSIFPSFINK